MPNGAPYRDLAETSTLRERRRSDPIAGSPDPESAAPDVDLPTEEHGAPILYISAFDVAHTTAACATRGQEAPETISLQRAAHEELKLCKLCTPGEYGALIEAWRDGDGLRADGGGYECVLCERRHATTGAAAQCCSERFDDSEVVTDGGNAPDVSVVADLASETTDWIAHGEEIPHRREPPADGYTRDVDMSYVWAFALSTFVDGVAITPRGFDDNALFSDDVTRTPDDQGTDTDRDGDLVTDGGRALEEVVLDEIKEGDRVRVTFRDPDNRDSRHTISGRVAHVEPADAEQRDVAWITVTSGDGRFSGGPYRVMFGGSVSDQGATPEVSLGYMARIEREVAP